MKRTMMVMLGLLVLVLFTACSNNSDNSNASKEGESVDVKELVKEYSGGSTEVASASVTSDELVVTNTDNSQTNYELPEDEFFVSIAPYENETHN